DRVEDVPGGRSITVANEFIDGLPVHQAVKREDGWHERVVTVTAEGNLAFDAAREPLQFFDTSLPRSLRGAPLGSIYEWRADTVALELGRRTRDDGAALIIDYGHAHSSLGDTLQAAARAAFTDPFGARGGAALTPRV